MEKIVIFGSTGMTGLSCLDAAIKKGLTVRAFVRDPSKVPEQFKNSVEVVQGDVLNYNDVLNAIRGTNGVVVVLGTGNDLKPTTTLSEGTKNILKAMKESNVEVVSVCLSAFMFYNPDKVPQMFRDVNADHQRQWDLLKESNLKYIAVCPPHIADQPGSDYQIIYDEAPEKWVISKYDLGRFLIDCLAQPEHFGKSCGISTKD